MPTSNPVALTVPSKPWPDFPLFADKHSRQWRKDLWQQDSKTGKKRAVPYYFGSWVDDPMGERAIKEWLHRQNAIRAGVDRLLSDQAQESELSLAEAFREVCRRKEQQLRNNEIADETFRDYLEFLQPMVDLLGGQLAFRALQPAHFSAYLKHMKETRKYGPHRIANLVRYIKAACRIVAKTYNLPEPSYGMDFVRPPTDKYTLRVQAAREGKEIVDVWLTPTQLNWLLENAQPWMKPMILLGLNCGFGPADIGRLRRKHVNLKTGRLQFARPKTGHPREAWLWKRTRKALEAIPVNEAHPDLFFVRRNGKPYVCRERVLGPDGRVVKVKINNAIGYPFTRLVRKGQKLGVLPPGKIGFYKLRHQYYTVAENGRDLNALHRTMGHTLLGQGNTYKDQRFPLPRLKRIAKYAFRKLLRVKAKSKPAPQAKVAGDGGGDAAPAA